MQDDTLLLTGALRVFHDFSGPPCADFRIAHDTQSPGLATLRARYGLDAAAGQGDDLAQALRLLRWVYRHVKHNGGGRDVEFIRKDALSILDYAYGKGAEYGVYCRLQAIVFTECCLALGLTARTLHCLPYSPADFDSHVVSMVYSRQLRRWALLDPGNNGYFLDRDGVPMGPLEARNALATDACGANEDLQPDSDWPLLEKQASYRRYMAKNLFYFKFSARNTFGTDLVPDARTYHLIPAGFDVKTREIAYCEHAIRHCPEPLRADWVAHLEGFRTQTIHTVSDAQFLRIE